MKVLVIDVGGTHVKLATNEPSERLSFPSGPDLTAAAMVGQGEEGGRGLALRCGQHGLSR
jgi:hypothetical protein